MSVCIPIYKYFFFMSYLKVLYVKINPLSVDIYI